MEETKATAPVATIPTTPVPPKKDWALDKLIKRSVKFFANILGMPDPETGAANTMVAKATSGPKQWGFVGKVWNAANTVVEKAAEVANKGLDVTGKVTDKAVKVTSSVADKAADVTSNVANKAVSEVKNVVPVVSPTPVVPATAPTQSLDSLTPQK